MTMPQGHSYWLALASIALLVGVMITIWACVPRERATEPASSTHPQQYIPNNASRPEVAQSASQSPSAGPRTVTAEPEVTILMSYAATATIQVQQVAQLNPGRHRFAVADGVLLHNGRRLASDHLVLPDRQGRWQVDQRPLRGALHLQARNDKVAVLLQLPLERYLVGVISKEVEPDWPVAALAAQAVAARSYALAAWQQQDRRSWTLQAEARADMAYAGEVTAPHQHLQQALAATRGKVLWYDQQAVPAFFHASSGGRSEIPAAVWPARVPDPTALSVIMPARLDPWAQAGVAVAPQRLGPWRLRLHLDDITQRLRAAGWTLPPVHRIAVSQRSAASGRVSEVSVIWPEGQRKVAGNTFRLIIGSRDIRSLLWTECRRDGFDIVISGMGYGHGVGLPQASAWAMAKAGHGYRDILRQYYPGAQLRQLW